MTCSCFDRAENMTILHIDSDIAWREKVAVVARSVAGVQRIDFASCIAATRELLGRNVYQVIVSELCLPDGDGFALINSALGVNANARIVVLTFRFDNFTLYKIGLGAVNSLVWKAPAAGSQLLKAISAQMVGKNYFPPEVELSREKLWRQPFAFFKIFSETEMKIIPLIGSGMSDREIADQLRIKPLTVKWHRGRIVRRSGYNSTNKFMRWAQEEGFCPVQLPAAPCVILDAPAPDCRTERRSISKRKE